MAGSVRFKGNDRQGRKKFELRAWCPVERRQVSTIVRATSKREADKALALFVADVERGEYRRAEPEPKADTLTVAQLVRRYMEWRRPDLAATTLANYAHMAEVIDTHPLGRMAADDVKVMDVESFGRTVTAKVGAPTAQKCHWLLSGAFRLAVKYELVTTNPVASADAPRLPKSKARPPTPDELAVIIAKATTDATKALIIFTASTGARRGEVCGLRWSDVDLDAGTVTIRHSYDDFGNLKDTKTANVRVLPLDDYTLGVLRSHRLATAERLLEAGQKLSGTTPVFGTPEAPQAHYTPHAMGRVITRLVKRAGITGVTMHSLRHFAGTHMIAAGLDARTAADRLGHASPTTTLRRYTHSTGTNDRRAADIVGGLVAKAAGE